MNNITGKNSDCCDESSDVDFTDITSDSINNSGLITTNELKVNLNTTTNSINNTLDIKTDVLTSSTITNTNTINTDSLKSNNNYYITADSKEFLNNHVNYTSNLHLWMLITPPANSNWQRLQYYLNPADRTVLLVRNNDINLGSKFNLKLSLQIVDTQQASGKIYEFRILFNSLSSFVIGTTIPPKHLTFTYLNINTDIVCSSRANNLYNYVYRHCYI